MSCPACGFENPAGIKFCGNCAQPLQALAGCPGCGFENPPGFKFCGECARPLTGAASSGPERDPRAYTPRHLADKILQSKSALEGERKQVTVLFADVKGSVELSGQVDPEQWHVILDRFFQILTDGVHRFEGSVNQYTGDGIMALFGAPIAHEDHAQRACYASLHLRAELRRYADELRVERGLSFAVRVGLNSGEVVVGKIGDDLRMDYTAQGHTVGLAARVERLAEPGRVYLTQHTARLVEGFFELRDLGKSKLAGTDDALAIYELEGVGEARTRLDLARSRGFSRFVGRDEEMATLDAALQRAIEGQGRVVGVRGEAGLGKSRLCDEFVRTCRAKGIAVYSAHCPSHGKTVPFLPLLQLLRGIIGIEEHDDPSAAREKIAGRLVLLDPQFQERLPLVFGFLGVREPERAVLRDDPENPGAQQRQSFTFVRRLVQALSEREPIVLFFDDLHWIDSASDAFLAQIVEAVSGTRILLLVNFRPEYGAEWMSGASYQQLPLVPLSPQAVAELLSDLLGNDASLQALPALVHERTEGNPFFTEELVRSLADSKQLEGSDGAYRLVTPVERLEVPATVQAVLAARIDRLPDREKQVLQTAAVIGRVFTEPILAAVSTLPASELGAALETLKATNFLYERALYPDTEYAFRHPLTEQVAFESQLLEKRRPIHAGVARALQAYSAETRDEQAALIAQHWERSGTPLEAARWHRRAADWIGWRTVSETAQHWRSVLDLLRDVPESTETEALALEAQTQIVSYSFRIGISPEETERLYADAKLLARRRGDLPAQWRLETGYYYRLIDRGRPKGAQAQVQSILPIAAQLDEPGVSASTACIVAANQLRLQDSLETLEGALARLPTDPRDRTDPRGEDPYLILRYLRGWYLCLHGSPREGLEELEQVLRLARPGERAAGQARGTCARFAILMGDRPRALSYSQEGLRNAERTGNVGGRVAALGWVGGAQLLEGQADLAIQTLTEALELGTREQVFQEFEALRQGQLAQAYLLRDDLDKARAMAERATDRLEERVQTKWSIEPRIVLARVLLTTDGRTAASEIESQLRQARTAIAESGAHIFMPFVREEFARLLRTRGAADSERELREAQRLYQELGATAHAERLESTHS